VNLKSVPIYDIAVIGGGPAGSTAAGFLAQAGARVIVLEKERFPRYHIGESLLSATLPILDALGVTPAIEAAGFVRKPGGTFLWGADAEPWSFFFREDPGGRPHAFHVLRSQFDHILLRHAASCGADVREEHAVRAIEFDPVLHRSRIAASPSPAARASDDAGRAIEIDARYVIDASGQGAFLGRRDGLREFNPFFKNLAIFGYFEDARRLDGPVAGNILSAAFADGWFWFIPLHDGTTSVGAVVDAQRFAGSAAGDTEGLYRRLIDACPAVAERLREGRLVSPVRIIRDYSYSSRSFHGPGYLLAGDAACFIDPVFSTGVHLACLSGYLAARALEGLLARQASQVSAEDERRAFDEYDGRYRAAFERYLRFLYFFYDHHVDAESYFWTARKILNPERALDARTSFIRLLSGGGDTIADAGLQKELAARHARLGSATHRGRFGAAPDADLFRVRNTLAELRERDGD
jgi:FAD-dependent halogenase